jgi:hypothetical protein
MNKTLGFKTNLVPLVLSGEKTITWRLFDEKNLAVGDVVDFLNSDSKKKFATAKLTNVIEKVFKDLNNDDWIGHEKFASELDMYKWYSEVYKSNVGPDTSLKIIQFEIIR